MKTIVIGLGNVLFTDDSVGISISQALKNKFTSSDLKIVEGVAMGLDILDIIAGYKKVIIIDAIQTTQSSPGSIYRLNIEQFSTIKKFSAHEIDILTALELGKKLGIEIPEDIVIFAIEAKDIVNINEECTPEVKAAIPLCLDMVIQELETECRV